MFFPTPCASFELRCPATGATPFDSRVDQLSKEYQAVEKEILRLQEKADLLKRELMEAQIAQASYRVHRLEEEIRTVGRNPILFRQIMQGTLPVMFEKDRATLNLIMRSDPTLAPNAQAVLDQIVILTGYIGNQPSPCPLTKEPPQLPQYPAIPCEK